VSEDYPAFIVNRILLPMINEAAFALYEGVGSIESIDEAMRLGANHRMGPLQLADFIGLDTCLSIMQVLNDGLGDSKYRPCPLLVNMSKPVGWAAKPVAAFTIIAAIRQPRRAKFSQILVSISGAPLGDCFQSASPARRPISSPSASINRVVGRPISPTARADL
jgi:hypothetical protein